MNYYMKKILLALIVVVGTFFTSCFGNKSYIPKQGDWQVVLEVEEPKVIDLLSGYSQDQTFRKVMKEAQQHNINNCNFMDAFHDEWNKCASGRPLRELFYTRELKYKVEDCSDSDVIDVLRREIEIGLMVTKEIINNRLLAAGFDEYQITRISNAYQLKIVMPNTINHDRVLHLLSASGQFGVWETYDARDAFPYLSELLRKQCVQEKDFKSKEQQINEDDKKRVGLKLISDGSAVVGYATTTDTSSVNRMLRSEEALQSLPEDLRLVWAVPSATTVTDKPTCALYGLHVIDPSGKALICDDLIDKAEVMVDDEGNNIVVLHFSLEGCRIYNLYTRENIGRSIAIVIDDVVYCAPIIKTEDVDGELKIIGNFTFEEANDFVAIVKSGRIILPLKIIVSGNL